MSVRLEATRRPCSEVGEEMKARVSAEGRLDRLALVRSPGGQRGFARNGGRRRDWVLDLELDFDPTALGEYWLANCQGFSVETLGGDEAVGVVDDVRVDPSTGRAVELEIAAGWFGRRRRSLPVEDVWAIVPLERVLMTRPTHDRRGR
jgi:hypothetical protein